MPGGRSLRGLSLPIPNSRISRRRRASRVSRGRAESRSASSAPSGALSSASFSFSFSFRFAAASPPFPTSSASLAAAALRRASRMRASSSRSRASTASATKRGPGRRSPRDPDASSRKELHGVSANAVPRTTRPSLRSGAPGSLSVVPLFFRSRPKNTHARSAQEAAMAPDAGSTASWSNSASGANGAATPGQTRRMPGGPSRAERKRANRRVSVSYRSSESSPESESATKTSTSSLGCESLSSSSRTSRGELRRCPPRATFRATSVPRADCCRSSRRAPPFSSSGASNSSWSRFPSTTTTSSGARNRPRTACVTADEDTNAVVTNLEGSGVSDASSSDWASAEPSRGSSASPRGIAMAHGSRESRGPPTRDE
mmetsp:Transcript_5567/g.23527  ORF Transcript_5567/g.23527 Transcript_5567/m.23527 type:complete len:373 (+) Transcript_5567:2467-3585(+)